jgi:hypothetical protein
MTVDVAFWVGKALRFLVVTPPKAESIRHSIFAHFALRTGACDMTISKIVQLYALRSVVKPISKTFYQ